MSSSGLKIKQICFRIKVYSLKAIFPLNGCVVIHHSVVSNSLRAHDLYSPPGSSLCAWNSPGKKTGVGSHFLLQGIFPTQGWNPGLSHLLHWQVGSLPLVPQFGTLLIQVPLSSLISVIMRSPLPYLILETNPSWLRKVIFFLEFLIEFMCVFFLKSEIFMAN